MTETKLPYLKSGPWRCVTDGCDGGGPEDNEHAPDRCPKCDRESVAVMFRDG